jgi:hypothetical protein
VFLRVAGHQSKEEKAKADTPKSEQQGDVAVNVQEESLNKTTKLDASSLAAFAEQQTFSRHFVALMAKRWHFSKRDERAICCSYVIPLLILVLGLSLLQLPSSFQYPPITMGKSFPSFYNSPLRVPYNSYIGDGAGNVVPSAGPFTMQNTFAYPNGVAEPMTLSVQNTSLYSRYEVKDFNVTVSGATMTILGTIQFAFLSCLMRSWVI